MSKISIEPNEVIFKNPKMGSSSIQSFRIVNRSPMAKSLVKNR